MTFTGVILLSLHPSALSRHSWKPEQYSDSVMPISSAHQGMDEPGLHESSVLGLAKSGELAAIPVCTARSIVRDSPAGLRLQGLGVSKWGGLGQQTAAHRWAEKLWAQKTPPYQQSSRLSFHGLLAPVVSQQQPAYSAPQKQKALYVMHVSPCMPSFCLGAPVLQSPSMLKGGSYLHLPYLLPYAVNSITELAALVGPPVLAPLLMSPLSPSDDLIKLCALQHRCQCHGRISAQALC